MQKYDSNDYPLSDLTEKIIGVALDVHKSLGPGFAEKIYQRSMEVGFAAIKINFEREKRFHIYYNQVDLGYGQVDFDIENKVILELKAVSELKPIHHAQLFSYLKATNRKVGLLINFSREKLEIKRLVR